MVPGFVRAKNCWQWAQDIQEIFALGSVPLVFKSRLRKEKMYDIHTHIKHFTFFEIILFIPVCEKELFVTASKSESYVIFVLLSLCCAVEQVI